MKRISVLVCFLCAVVLSSAPSVRAAEKAGDGETNFNVGLGHLRERRPAAALEEFKKAVKLNGSNPYFQKGLGLAYTQLGKYPEAVAAFRKALELNPYYVDVRNDLGTALILSGKRPEGRDEFLKAFNDATNPTPELSARNLGQAYLEENNFTEAVNWFQTTLNRNKAVADAYLGLADAWFGLGKPQEAIPTLEVGNKEFPNHLGILVNLAEAYYRAGRFNEARGRFEEVTRKDPAGEAGRQAAERLKNFPR
jgi:Tfp pilus assembly protein PilF